MIRMKQSEPTDGEIIQKICKEIEEAWCMVVRSENWERKKKERDTWAVL
jgi:adenine/guanine phosphoribosyltransferase-like PRPP-binding protein